MNKPKVRIYLMGGLGNNLSQLFFAYKLQAQGYEIEINNFLCSKNLITKILKWSLHDQSVQDIYKEKFKIRKINIFTIIIDLFFLNLSRIFNAVCFNRFFDGNRIKSFNEIMNIENRKFIVFAGYWQQLNIYKENELNEFKRFLFGNIKSNISKDIGIHIRGGDFLRLKKSLGMSFYDNALNQFKCFEPVTIFTNDKKYSKEILPKSLSYQFSENDNSKDDFLEMLNFKRLICSNSTFSIWAGLLSRAEEIILPKKDGETLKMNINSDLFKFKKITVL